jgi:uncharacterized membrane protein YbhN (UPF0104 family)
LKMSKKWNNIFFFFGLAAIVIMLLTFDSNYSDIIQVLHRAGICFPVVLALWLVIYLVNAFSWSLIIRDKQTPKVPFSQVFKMTISGFALNYTTPFGLMGGEPYRIMELSGYVGKKKATSSVLLYVMMHILSHFCFWLTSIILYVVLHFMGEGNYPLDLWLIIMFVVLATVFIIVCSLFSRGFKYGFVVKVFSLLKKIPIVKKWAVSFESQNIEKLKEVDEQIAQLRESRKTPFWGSLSLEYLARFISCIEYWLILRVMMPSVTYFDCVFIMAFSSLFSNILFFSPMQLGSREGGLAIASVGLSIPSSFGLFTALVTRLRELFWIVIGIVLMKVKRWKS